VRVIDVVRAINDAAALQSVLLPLVTDALDNGATEIPDEAVAAAKAKLDTDIARVEAKAQAMPDPAG
jgi:hypothetical protein